MYIYICTYNSIIYNNYINRNGKNLIYFMKFKNNYTQVKKKAEEIINKIRNSQFFINILRIPEVNTMQNLSVLNNDLPNFIQLINKDIKFKNKVFFKNLI